MARGGNRRAVATIAPRVALDQSAAWRRRL